LSFSEANRLGREGKPFLIIVNYNKNIVITTPLDELELHDIEFQIDEVQLNLRAIDFQKKVVSLENYKKMFNKVIDSIKRGFTYVLNLTQPTEVLVNSTLKEIYNHAEARYKLRYKDDFICYSPETFIAIKDNKIATYPMKGTLDASTPDGENLLYNNQKESAEHVMIVDLLRNDLNMVSKNVRVEKFKYIERINSGKGELFQMSSKVVGELEDGWQSRIGDILETMLPAGSITGTPKRKTVELINEIENYDRGFFTGIFGVFQDNSFRSGVMIRFLEKRDGKFIYKSGGGVTLDSDLQSEYREMIDKVYLF
jgi:para-aminobenzoate synthetase component 1